MAPTPDPDSHATPASRVQTPSKNTGPSKPKTPTTADSLLQEDNITSDSPSAELTASVESLLDALTRKFSSVSAEIFTKTALLGNYVYIDGGELGLPGPDDQDRVKRANDRTYSIDVSKNWSTSSISIRTIDKPTSLPSLVSPALWSDSSANVLYSFGGDTSWDPPVNKTSFQNRFQKFIPDGSGGGEWSPDLDRTDDDVPDHISPPVGGFISQAKESGFYLGGYEPYAAVMDARYRRPAGAVPQPGIVTFNFENRIWTNDTITPYTLGGGSVGYGAMHYVPIFGPAGLLIIFGGESEDHGVPSKQLMNNITIYEHEGKTWHYQIATGSVIPKYRQYMCTVGVREDGQQSFMYGGFSGDFGPGQIDYDDIWILSIPAFQWFKAHGVSSGSRFGHTCHDVGGRYMMTIGGITALVHAKERWNGPDTTDYSIALFDMTNLTWTDTFSPQSPSYERPSVVRSWYEANGQYPERWDQPALKDLIVNNSKSYPSIVDIFTQHVPPPFNPHNS
ncbi:MAG: hypothetical protein M1815_002812 [Lichina confinis]|nr:MAG: hypothetical protein M1815_002812 [Lichina confinis]